MPDRDYGPLRDTHQRVGEALGAEHKSADLQAATDEQKSRADPTVSQQTEIVGEPTRPADVRAPSPGWTDRGDLKSHEDSAYKTIRYNYEQRQPALESYQDRKQAAQDVGASDSKEPPAQKETAAAGASQNAETPDAKTARAIELANAVNAWKEQQQERSAEREQDVQER